MVYGLSDSTGEEVGRFWGGGGATSCDQVF
jgi:hypothetical protein